jgi:rubrerythrin
MSKKLRVLEYAMAMEKQGAKFYSDNKEKFENQDAKDLFERLARVEMEHYNILKEHYDALMEDDDWESLDIEISGGEEIYEKELKASNVKVDSLNASDVAIMRMAYLIENDFAEFYKKALESAEHESEKTLLRMLVEWEEGHRQLFYREFQDLMENNWFKQGFYPF